MKPLDGAWRAVRRARAVGLAGLLVVGALSVGGCGGHGGTSKPPTYSLGIFDAQWIGGTDLDGDGFWETRRLAWDADVSRDDLTKSVKVKVYARPSDETTWTLLGTTDCYSITGGSDSDVYYVDVSGFPQGTWDFKLELYECSGTSVADRYGPTDDPDLSGKDFEELAYRIYGAAWDNRLDVDQDGCWEGARLYWDADVTDGLTKSVQANIYARPTGTASWSYLAPSTCYTISGTSSSDLAWVDLSGGPGSYDFRIDLYECGEPSPVASLGPAAAAELHDRCWEPALEISDASWANALDADHDGFWESADLIWNANVVASDASLPVKAKVYYRPTGGSTWTLLTTTQCYTITGNSGTNAVAIPVAANVRACYDFLIDLYDCGGTMPAARLALEDDPDLYSRCLEP